MPFINQISEPGYTVVYVVKLPQSISKSMLSTKNDVKIYERVEKLTVCFKPIKLKQYKRIFPKGKQ